MALQIAPTTPVFVQPVGPTAPTSNVTQASIGALLYPQTPAEIAAGVVPTNFAYPEGDIRRYGALTTNADNSAAIDNALLVNEAGGAAVYIPAGTWKHTSTLNPTTNSSMHGEGGVSILAPQNCDGLTFGIGSFYGPGTGFSRAFRDFVIAGNNAVNSTNSAIVANFTAASGNRVAGIYFERLFISNFYKAFNVRGLWNCSIINCFGYNNYNGIYFIGQNVRNVILGGGWVRGPMTGAGQAWGISFQSTAGESTQSTQALGAYTFGYDIGVNCVLALLTQFDNCDISSNQLIGVNITTINGGFMLTNSWVEMQAAGVAVTGVAVNALAVSGYQDIHIKGNHIANDNPFAGSVGLSVGSAQVAVTATDNSITGFDIGMTNAASPNLTFKFNRINILNSGVYSATSSATTLNTQSADNEIGPNFIEAGNAATTPAFFQAATMSNGSTVIAVPTGGSFPIGTPVQFDASQNGFISGVTYFVVAQAANSIAVAPVAGGAGLVASGAAAVNVFAAPVPLSFNAGTPPGLTFFGRGAFIATVGGYASPQFVPMSWVSSGKLVSIAVTATITGTSAAVSMNVTGLPSFLNPPTAKQIVANVTDSGVATYGMLGLATSGAMTFSKTPAGGGGFTASGTKAINVQDLIYSYA